MPAATLSPATAGPALPLESIERRIYLIRGQKVMLDADLAIIYQVPTSRLNEAVKRNIKRFPDYFMFRLTSEEYECLISQTAISKPARGGRRSTHKDLAARIENIETHQRRHASVISILADEIEQLKTPPAPPKRSIGFPAARVG